MLHLLTLRSGASTDAYQLMHTMNDTLQQCRPYIS